MRGAQKIVLERNQRSLEIDGVALFDAGSAGLGLRAKSEIDSIVSLSTLGVSGQI